MSTNAYVAKRAIYARLLELARTGPLSTLGSDGRPLQIRYDGRAGGTDPMLDRCIYGGGVTFTRDADRAIVDGGDYLYPERVMSLWYVRLVAASDVDQRDLDVDAERVCDVFGQVFVDEPGIAGGNSRTFIEGGQGDYSLDAVEGLSIVTFEVVTETSIR